MARSSEPGRSTASRLFAVLGSFRRASPVLTLTQVAAASGLPLATAYRLLRELTACDAVERLPDGRYRIGLRLGEIGSLAPRQRDLRRVAAPVMQSLHEATNQTVQLAVPTPGGALVVEKVSGTHAAPHVTEIGGVLPWHATAVGKVLLGFGPGDVLERLTRQRLRGFTPFTITDVEALLVERAAIQRDRIAFCREELTRGTASAAAPVFDADGRIAAAVGVLTSSAGALPRLAPTVRMAALTVSERLGLRGSCAGAPLQPAR